MAVREPGIRLSRVDCAVESGRIIFILHPVRLHDPVPVCENQFPAGIVALAATGTGTGAADVSFRFQPRQVVHARCLCHGDPGVDREIERRGEHPGRRRLLSIFRFGDADANRLALDG